MKKAGLFIISVLLISLLSFVISVSAQEAAPGLEGAPLVNEIQAGQQQYEQYTAAQNKSDYLKQEWVKIVEKNKILGPILNVINPILKFMNPVFKIVLGYESSLSWAFVFALIIWFALFFLIYPPASQLFNNSLFGGIASFALVGLIGLSGAIKTVVEILNTIITNTWMFWISLAIAIILAFVFGMFGKQIKNWIKKTKQKTREEVTEMAQKKIQAHGEISGKALESLSK